MKYRDMERISGQRSRKKFKEWEKRLKNMGYLTDYPDITNYGHFISSTKPQSNLYFYIQRIRWSTKRHCKGRFTVWFEVVNWNVNERTSFKTFESALAYMEMVVN